MSLVSKTLRIYLRRAFTFGQIFHAHPYIWAEEKARPELDRVSKKGVYWWYINLGVTLFYSIFVGFRGVQVNLGGENEATPARKMYIKSMLFYLAFPALFQLSLWLRTEELPQFFRESVALMKNLDEKLARKMTKEEQKSRGFLLKIIDLFLRALFYNLCLFPPVIGLLATLRPHSPEFLSSVILPQVKYYTTSSTWIRLTHGGCILFQMYYIYLYAAGAFVWIYTGFSALFPTLLVLLQLKRWLLLIKEASKEKERLNDILKTYRELQVLLRCSHDLFFSFFFPMVKVILMGITVYSTYGAIRMEGLLAAFFFLLGLCCFIILTIVVGVMAEFHGASEKILFLLKTPAIWTQGLSAVQKKRHSSLTLVQIQMGSSYVIDKACVVTVLKIVSDTVIDLLVANS